MRRRSGFQVMARLIGLVKPLAGFMALAILMGLAGHLCAAFITIFGGYAVLSVLGFGAPLGLTALFVCMGAFALLRGILRYAEQSCNHFIAFKLLALIRDRCRALGVNVALSEVWGRGGEGGVELAQEVLRLCGQTHQFRFAYELGLPLRDKIEAIVRRVYGGDGVNYSSAASRELDRLEAMGFGSLPVCMAKTQYSLSDDPGKLGRPEGFTVTVSKVWVSAGAGFVVVQTGDIMTMPGLPKVPAAEKIDVDENGVISGLF